MLVQNKQEMNLPMKIYKHIFILILGFLLVAPSLLAQKKLDLDTEEKAIRKERLKKLNKESFLNRSNEKADEATRKADIATGQKLSELLESDPKKSHTHKGIIVRRFESDEEGRFGGDILDMTKDAQYGHINGIIRVVSGYVNKMFDYNMEDSELLALYVVYYNFKHRGNMAYIGENFDTDYSKFLKKDKLGIPENFTGWAGKTEIIVPTEKNLLKGGGIDIATYELEDQVNPDIDIQSKKKFDNLQKRKIKSEKEEVMEKYEQVLKREKQLLDRRKEIDARLAELMKDPEKNKEEIARLLAEKKKIDAELEKIAVEKKRLEEKIEQINRREEMRKLGFTSEKEYMAYAASKKKPEPEVIVKEEPRPVAKEEPKSVVKEEPKILTPPTPVGKNFIQAFHTKGKIIVARESISIPEVGIVAIGYETPVTENSVLNLFLFGSGEFELVRVLEGVKLYKDTPFVYEGGKIYILEEFTGKIYLTQLNGKLEIEARSSDPVDPNSDILVTTETVQIVKKGTKEVMNFRKKDLTLIK